MKYSLPLAVCLILITCSLIQAQAPNREKGNGKTQRGGAGISDIEANPQNIGEAGVAWYTTWDTGLAEAKRSNRPIFFMSAATTCSGVSGVF